MAAKISKPVLYSGVLVFVVAIFMMTSPGEPSAPTKSLKDLRAGSGSKRVATAYAKDDLEASFPRLNEQAKNAFKPLVARMEAGLTGGGLAPNEFPASFAGGEIGWFYTGTVVEDNIPSALVENQLTGEGMYLLVGQKLGQTVIAQISPTYIVVRDTTGQSLRLDLLRDTPEIGDGYGDLLVEPVRPDVGDLARRGRGEAGQLERGLPGIEE